MDWFEDGGSKSPVDVAALMDSRGVDHIAAIVAQGALVSIGVTSDGGALGITVTLDGRWKREYFRDAEAMGDWLAEALDGVAAAVRTASASPGPRRRSRRA